MKALAALLALAALAGGYFLYSNQSADEPAGNPEVRYYMISDG